jgi:hypothetical protein
VMVGDIVVIALVTSYVIMGEIVKETSDEIFIRQPVFIMPDIQSGEVKYSFVPYLKFTDEYYNGMRFDYKNIINRCDPITAMKEEYIENYMN